MKTIKLNIFYQEIYNRGLCPLSMKEIVNKGYVREIRMICRAANEITYPYLNLQ